jgi:uroporphyrinogen-III synthase
MKKKIITKNIWISRNLSEKSLFHKLLISTKSKVEGQSLINQNIIKINHLPKSSWIFINSAFALNSIMHLKNQIIDQKIAAFGNSTADYVRKHGLNIDFVGEGNPENIADKFKTFLSDDDIVYFPCSDRSIGTVQSKIPSPNKVIQVTYETVLKNLKLTDYDILVFTSPSNVDAFKLANNFQNEIVISIGPSTTKSLNDSGVKKVYQVHESSELALAEYICSIA